MPDRTKLATALSAGEREQLTDLVAEAARVTAGLWQELIRDRASSRVAATAQLSQVRGCLDRADELLDGGT